uniref:Uncharacterized protein n=1 Tax=Erinnyis ello granulovirus TaxID=307444 RepID=A0A288WH37_9BBAC|nr:hypothetical protein EREL_004 [Erinnyis ello granulovirus]
MASRLCILPQEIFDMIVRHLNMDDYINLLASYTRASVNMPYFFDFHGNHQFHQFVNTVRCSIEYEYFSDDCHCDVLSSIYDTYAEDAVIEEMCEGHTSGVICATFTLLDNVKRLRFRVRDELHPTLNVVYQEYDPVEKCCNMIANYDYNKCETCRLIDGFLEYHTIYYSLPEFLYVYTVTN